MIKMALITSVLFVFACEILAQKPDKFSFMADVTAGIMHIRVSGREPYDETGTTRSYRNVDTLSILAFSICHLGLNIPVYSTYKWSTGIIANGGIGYQSSLKAAKGMESYLFSIPVYAYYYNFSSDFEYSTGIGLKRNINRFPHTLLLFFFEFRRYARGFRLYGSLNRPSFSLADDNDINDRVTVKIREFGFSYTMYIQ